MSLACALLACDTSGERGAAEVTAVLNGAPVVERIVPDPTRIDVGDATRLRVDVADPDGDALTLSWSATCEGLFAPAPGAANDVIFSLAAATGDACTLAVTVRDERGGRADGAVQISTGPGLPGSGAQ